MVTLDLKGGFLLSARARAPTVGPGAPRRRGGSGASPPAFAQGVSAGLLAGVCLRARVFHDLCSFPYCKTAWIVWAPAPSSVFPLSLRRFSVR